MVVKDWNDRPKRFVLWKSSVVSIKRSRSPRSSLQIKAIVQTRFQGFSFSPGDEHEGNLGTRFAIAVIHSLHRSRFPSRRSSNIPPQQTMNYLARNGFRTRTIAVIGLNREWNVVRMRPSICWGRGLRDGTKTAARENRWCWAPSFKLDNAFHRINYSTVDKC